MGFSLEAVIAAEAVLRRLATAASIVPLLVAVGERPPTAGSPISQALRALGVRRGTHFDEFDAVGLGRCRDTEDWLVRPNE